MYKKILSAVNEHLNSEVSARYALHLARACRARFYISFIADSGMPQSGIDRAGKAMKRLFAEARNLGVQVESITGVGDPVREIDRIVRHEEINLVFASTRREDVEKRFYAGTIARRLSLRLPCSVALVRVVHMGKIHPHKILVPLKARINRMKERVFFTARMAEAFNAKVCVFHCKEPIERFFHGEIHLTPVKREAGLPGDISDFIGHIGKYRIELEGRLSFGAALRSITIEAASKRHDLIIMGASERSLLTSILKGNPVEDVLRETPCNLIILKPRHED